MLREKRGLYTLAFWPGWSMVVVLLESATVIGMVVVDAGAELDCFASFGFENGPGSFSI